MAVHFSLHPASPIDFLKELENHLDPLTGTYSITIWHRKKVIPGQEQQKEIDKHLKAARIILLMVSSSYLGSKNYLCNYEVQRAMDYKKAGAVEVIPVLLRAVYWEHAPYRESRTAPYKWSACTAVAR